MSTIGAIATSIMTNITKTIMMIITTIAAEADRLVHPEIAAAVHHQGVAGDEW